MPPKTYQRLWPMGRKLASPRKSDALTDTSPFEPFGVCNELAAAPLRERRRKVNRRDCPNITRQGVNLLMPRGTLRVVPVRTGKQSLRGATPAARRSAAIRDFFPEPVLEETPEL
jgi:hypothetical protein